MPLSTSQLPPGPAGQTLVTLATSGGTRSSLWWTSWLNTEHTDARPALPPCAALRARDVARLPRVQRRALRPYLRRPAGDRFGGDSARIEPHTGPPGPPGPPQTAGPDGVPEHELQALLKFKMLYGRPYVLIWTGLLSDRTAALQHKMSGCLVQVGNGIELEAVGLQFKPYLWCDLGFFPNSRGNKAAANLRPTFVA